eukprot:scaffold95147_cov30-Phaeocystis_antarctica.AAC.1
MLDEAVEPVGAVLGTTCMVTPPGWSEAVEWAALVAMGGSGGSSLARAPEAVTGRPVARPRPGSTKSCQGPEEAREPSWGTAKGAVRPCCATVHCDVRR